MKRRIPLPALTLLGVLAMVATAGARALPLNVELDGCVMPAPACETVRDVITLNEHDRKLSFAVETLHLRSTTRATTGSILTEMQLRPLRLYGPDELVARVKPGARLRIRAALRLGDRYMMLTAVEPRTD